jgi:MFS superfamily sulfate permease-like transporter
MSTAMRVSVLATRHAGRFNPVRTLASTVGIPSNSIVFHLSSMDREEQKSSARSQTTRSFSIKLPDASSTNFRKNAALPPIDITTKSASTKASDDSENDTLAKAPIKKAVSDDGFDILGIKTMVPEWKHMFNKDTLFTDISAGLTVGCVAVPLSLAIALASGVPAEVGLVTAAVSGIAGGLMGGTTLAVTGPAAAISLLVVGAVEQHGLAALPVITLGCGALQLASGASKLGVVAKLCPVSVIAGFTTGVGTLILTNQLPKALGMTAPTGLNPVELLGFIGQNMAEYASPASAAVAVGTSAAMFLLPKIHPKMPSALVAVGGATVATHAFGLDVSLIGAIPSGIEAFQCCIPTMPPVEALPSLAGSTFLIYSMTSVESLLSCAALEKMKKTTYKHNPDQELIGQGLANIGSAMFMGMPVTSVIARSSLNARLNASTRLPALIQSGFVFSSVVFMSSTIAMVPMPALSGVLITTGMGMLNPAELKNCYAVQKSDAIPFAATIAGMVSMGLAEGIGIGCVTALGMNAFQTYQMNSAATSADAQTDSKMKAFELIQPPSSEADDSMIWQARCGTQLPMALDARGMHTMSAAPSEKTFSDIDSDDLKMMDPAKNTIWQLNGPINFLSMFEIDNMIKKIEGQDKTEAIVLDMQGVTIVEFTGIEELVTRLIEASDDHGGVPIQMVNLTEEIEHALDQCDTTGRITRVALNQ